MRSIRMAGIAMGSALAGAALVVALVTGISAPRASAATAGVTESTVTASVGDEVPTTLAAVNIGAPGLGAWSVNVTYDPTIVSLTDCTPGTGGVCNPAFSADTARTAGASASGLEGDTVLATITFRCIHLGRSALTISIDTLADSTPGAPQDIPNSTTDGAVTCEAPVTPTAVAPTVAAATATRAAPTPTAVVAVAVNAGSGPGSNNSTVGIWLVAALIGAGIAWLSAGVAGAGLASARSTRGGPRRPDTQSSLPSMKPSQHTTRPEERSAPGSPSPIDIPSFRPARRPR